MAAAVSRAAVLLRPVVQKSSTRPRLQAKNARGVVMTAAAEKPAPSVVVPKKRLLPAPGVLKAVCLDIDGTLANSDPLHYQAFREMLVELKWNDGQPISEEFFLQRISGGENEEIFEFLFPDWEPERRTALAVTKEGKFREVARRELKPTVGLHRFAEWIEKKGLRRAAVSNAPRPNAELMLDIIGLKDFFELIIIGEECERAKPFPDPYLKALKEFGVSPSEAFAVEDSLAGLGAAVAAKLPVIGIATVQKPEKLSAVGATFTITDFNDPALWEQLED
eukprot:jgi/Chlat1/1085/Chrsp110S01576